MKFPKLNFYTALKMLHLISKKRYFERISKFLRTNNNSYPLDNGENKALETYKNLREGIYLQPSLIKIILASPTIKVVSFDIFDTLLFRPVLDPKDLFYLIAGKVDEKFSIDFVKLRRDAETQLKKRNASINDIYESIKNRRNLSEVVTKKVMEEELKCEYDLLRPREDIRVLYREACRLGKKIIVISDMYLPKNFLKKVLFDNGFDQIDELYISNECGYRKDEGKLYDFVLEKEKVNSHEICHIGDNYYSDYRVALTKGISAIYYPSIRDIVFSKNTVLNKIWDVRKISNDPYTRILMGFSICNAFSSYRDLPAEAKIYGDLKHFVKLFLGPLLVYIVFSISTNKEIQKSGKYNQIFFASRDGYLPKMVYDIFAEYIDILPSLYLYSGRRAYFTYLEDSFSEFCKKLNCHEGYILQDFINAFFPLDGFSDELLELMSEEELSTPFKKRKECINILKKFEKEIDEYYYKHRKGVYDYYNTTLQLASDKQEVVFSCSNSGSISKALTKITGVVWDKICLWQTWSNKLSDWKHNTTTYCLLGDLKVPACEDLLLEELFSPCEGGVVGFRRNKEVKENVIFNEEMKRDLDIIHEETCNFSRDFCNLFKNYLNCFPIKEFQAIQKSYDAMVRNFKSTTEYSLFKNIDFPDPVYRHSSISLSQKLANEIKWDNVFDGTGFSANVSSMPYKLIKASSCRIGMHIHLYNFYLYNEFIYYLSEFPVNFDLIITISDTKIKKTLENLFNKDTIPNLSSIKVKLVPNRGRDVMPWLVYTKEEQSHYDIFCHLHSKESSHSNFGNEWRQYLLEKLLRKERVLQILNVLSQNDVGLVFPDFFPKLKSFCINNKIKLEGMDGEINVINDLVKKMGVRRKLNRSDICFSGGTMFWYKTDALLPLFELGLKVEDFPEEPIALGGTLAHAIEHIPAIVCQSQGKRVVIF